MKLESKRNSDALVASRELPTVLCVDDDPEISRVIELHLRRFDVRVLRAFCGMQGFWMALSEAPDCIITDLGMPHGGGEYMLDCLQRNRRTMGIPVVVLTGDRRPGVARRLSSRGAIRFLVKPASVQDLLQAVSQHINLTRST